MKGLFLFCVLICTDSSFAIPSAGSTIKSTLTTSIEPTLPKDTLSNKDFIKLKIKDYEKYTGKKLTLKEKIAFKIVQHRLNKGKIVFSKPAESNKGKTALILGIIGLVLVFVPYAIIASIPLAIIAIVMGNEAKKVDPSNKKARTAVVLGWVTLGLFFLFLLIALVLVAAFLGGFG